MNTPLKLDRSLKRKHGDNDFKVEILFPGLRLANGDSGIGAIGRIDHAHITPGTVVAMHPHRNDEILTYLRKGKLIHRDTFGESQEVSTTRMMLMSAGHTFEHEEEAEGEPLEALQIFIRPREADLAPLVQFHDFESAHSVGKWRLIASPVDAPLQLRAEVWIHDARLQPDHLLTLPAPPVPDVARLLYVFAGEADAAGISLVAGESILIGHEPCEVKPHEQCDLVLFTTDLAAPVFDGGMFSGNTL